MLSCEHQDAGQYQVLVLVVKSRPSTWSDKERKKEGLMKGATTLPAIKRASIKSMRVDQWHDHDSTRQTETDAYLRTTIDVCQGTQDRFCVGLSSHLSQRHALPMATALVGARGCSQQQAGQDRTHRKNARITTLAVSSKECAGNFGA